MASTHFTPDPLRTSLETWPKAQSYSLFWADHISGVSKPTFQSHRGLLPPREELCEEIANAADHSDIAPPSLTVEQLQRGLQTLPQELYDGISALTFNYDGGSRDINEAYEPPVQLQINHQIRQEFSRAYYGSQEPWWHSSEMHHNLYSLMDQTFLGRSSGLPIFEAWLVTLSEEVRLMLVQSRRGVFICDCSLYGPEYSFEDAIKIQLYNKSWGEGHSEGRVNLEHHSCDLRVIDRSVVLCTSSGRIKYSWLAVNTALEQG